MRDWPHSPVHRLGEACAYMVTAGTYRKQPFFRSPDRLDFLCVTLLDLAEAYGWQLQAWAVLANHYHFVGFSPPDPEALRSLIRKLHSLTAREINRRDHAEGRKVWFEYWETRLTFERSYFARLSYVHRNAVHHGLVRSPWEYPWCSARWFERKANRAFWRRIMGLPINRVNVPDDYLVDASCLVSE
ncbi:MAG: transposase [Acidobacteria bacterium]|nr:transposase [Acidobacteriota bacterium]